MGSSWAEAWGLFFYCEGGTRRDGRADGGYAPGREGRRGVRAGTGRKRMSAQGWKTMRRG